MTESALASLSQFFEPRSRPVRLPAAEALRLFEAEHVPRTKKVLQRGLRDASLLDRHGVGACFNFIKDQHLHRARGISRSGDFFRQVFQIPVDLHTRLWEAGKLARGLHSDWVAAARCQIPQGAALAIAQGDPPLAAPIRQFLFELAQDPDRGALRQRKTMERVCRDLRDRLRDRPGQAGLGPDLLLSWVEESLVDPDPDRSRSQDRRRVPRDAGDPGNADLLRRFEGMERELLCTRQQMAWQQQEIAWLRGALEGRPSGPTAPAYPTDLDPAPSGSAQSRESAAGTGAPGPGPAAHPADPDPDASRAGSGSTAPEPEAQAADERPPRVRMPSLLSEHDDALPITYPGFPLSSFELQTCELIVASAELCRQVRLLMKGRGEPGAALSFLLQLRTDRACERFVDQAQAARQLVGQAAALGRSCLESQAGAGQPLRLPVYTDYRAGLPQDFHPISWVVVAERDPLEDPCPQRLEPTCWRLLGVLEALHQRLPGWLHQRQAGAVADCTLLYQLEQGLALAQGQVSRVRGEFFEGAAQGAYLEQCYGYTAARLEVSASSAVPPDPNLVLLGSDERVAAFCRLGLDARGRHLALSLFTSQFVLALGGRGWGKSHLGRLIAECLHLYLPGVNRLPHPLHSATFELDYHLGTGRRQMLRGLFPNPNAAQLEQLRAYYRSTVDNAAFRQGLLRCLPASVATLRKELAAYLERGLVIEPIELGPQNLGQMGWESILGSSFQHGADRPLYADHLAALIGVHGDRLTPERMLAELEEGKEFSRVRGGLINQVQPLCGLVRPGADVRDDLKLQVPLFYLLECRHSPESFLLGLLVAILQGLSAPTGRPADETMLWLFCDELSKLMDLPVVGRLLLSMAKELRHRKVSLFLGGQTASNLPADLLGLVSVFFLFHLSNRAGFAPLKELEYFRDTSFDEQVRTLPNGQALVGAVNCTDPLLRQAAQWLWLRPAFIDAGGESLTLL